MEEICLFWFRRDLRLNDNTGLYHALNRGYKVLPVFLFDKQILNQFEKPINRQVEFIYKSIISLNTELKKHNSSLLIGYDTAYDFFYKLFQKYNVKAIYLNEDYEFQAIYRDKQIEELCRKHNISFHQAKDQVIFSKNEIVKDDGKPYTVFTPYAKKWKSELTESSLTEFDIKDFTHKFYKFIVDEIVTLNDIGFKDSHTTFPACKVRDDVLLNYEQKRDYPSLDATSHLGVHLRFGTISIRQLVKKAISLKSEAFLNELIWREFYQAITYHFPHICEGKSFNKKYDLLKWLNDETLFIKWCNGNTGFPIVDAGMRQLNETGFMHNRVRMITASFLVKHLLIDWRWGEAYFANKLIDFDFASNNGGWQWSAGCGCDTVPYFRIFNPSLQTKRFDLEEEYIKKWIPELYKKSYPKPIIDHDYARRRAISFFKESLLRSDIY